MKRRRLASSALAMAAVLAAAASCNKRSEHIPAIMNMPQPGRAVCMAFSPDGRTLASGGNEGIWIWDAETGVELKALKGYNCSSLAYSPDSRTLAAVAGTDENNRTVMLIDTATGKVKPVETIDPPVHLVAYSPDGKMIASDSGKNAGGMFTIRLWDAETGAPLRDIGEINSIGEKLIFSPDSERLVSLHRFPTPATNETTERAYYLITWDVETGGKRFEPPPFRYMGWWRGDSAVYSPNGQRLALAGGSEIGLFDAYNAELVQKMHRHEYPADVVTMAYSPNNSFLASGDNDGNIHLWDAYTGKHLKELKAYNGTVSEMAFSPDGTKLGCVNHFGHVWVWDLKTMEMKQ